MLNSVLFSNEKLPSIFLTVIWGFILVIFFLIFIKFAKYVKNSITKMRRKSREKRDRKKKYDIMYYQLGMTMYYLIIIAAVCFIIPFLGIQQSSVIAILGTVSLGLCLSSQSILANIWSSISIVLNDIYNIGDVVSVRINSIGTVKGTIVDFNLFYTKLLDENGSEISIPNNILYGSNCVVVNESINK